MYRAFLLSSIHHPYEIKLENEKWHYLASPCHIHYETHSCLYEPLSDFRLDISVCIPIPYDYVAMPEKMDTLNKWKHFI